MTNVRYSRSYTPLPAAAPVAGGHGSEPDRAPELADVGRLARRAVRSVVRAARVEERATWSAILAEHLGPDLDTLAVVEERWEVYDQPNLQAGLDAWLAADAEREHRLVGITGFRHHQFGLSDLILSPQYWEQNGPRPGNVARANHSSGPDGQVIPCVQCGLYLITEPDRRSALLLRAADRESGMSQASLQIVSSDPAYAAEIGAAVRRLAVEHNVFRGQVLSFGGDVFGHEQTLLTFHRRPDMRAEDLILPTAVIESVERQVVGVATHRERLLAAGQHLKRGLLLHGPPGVGKTHTVRYLTARLTDTTILQVTGMSLGLIGQACSIARTLQPSVVVVEDVDLIAEDRGMHPGEHPLLFALLNEMDGLAEDADVVFLLTTNRADLLEAALAARPGRVDQAVEITLPDADARRRLFSLYRGDLVVDEARLDGVLEQTDGVTASFLKELLRRAAVLAAGDTPDGQPIRVSADRLDEALAELLDTRNAMTRVLLGGSPQER